MVTRFRDKDVDPSEELWDEIVSVLTEDEKGLKMGPEAQYILDAGQPVYYGDDSYPGEIVKMYPDGRREIIAYDENYEEVFVRKIEDFK